MPSYVMAPSLCPITVTFCVSRPEVQTALAVDFLCLHYKPEFQGYRCARTPIHSFSSHIASIGKQASDGHAAVPRRLYSSAHFNDTFPLHTPPEILNTPLEGVVLALKALAVDRVAHFPFPTPPEPQALAAAQRCLEALAALRAGEGGGGLTDLGRLMARFPVSPRHARMLLQVRTVRCRVLHLVPPFRRFRGSNGCVAEEPM